MASIAQAYVEILPSAKGMSGALKKEMGGTEKTISDSTGKGFLAGVKGIAGPLAAAVGALGIGTLVADSIAAASDLSETRSAVETVFGDANAAVQDFASTASKALGMTQQQALEGARKFGIFGQAAGLSGVELSSFSTDLVSLATDFASFNNVEPEQAIEAIGAGLRGESEPLRQFGILLDDAALRARAMEMGIYDGNGALTQQQRVMAAQAEIFAQAGVQQGDFARTSDGLANQQRILSASLGDLSASFGTLLLPVMTEIVGFLNDTVMPALQDFSTWMQENPELVKIIAIALGVLAVALAAAAIAQWILNVAMLANPIGIVIAAIVALIAIIVLLVANWDSVVSFVTSIWGNLLNFFKSTGQSIALWWIGLWRGIGAFFASVWSSIVSFVTSAINNVRGRISGAVNTIRGLWERGWNIIRNVVSTAFGNIQRGVQTGITNVINFVKSLPGKAKSALGNVGGILLSAGRSLIQGFINGIKAMVGKVGDAIGGVMNFAKSFFPSSPAKRGPFSGAGWRQVGQAGAAIEKQFESGFTGRMDDVISSRVSVPNVPMSAEVASYAAGQSGATITDAAMDRFAVRVAAALVEVRKLDGRGAVAAVQRGAI